MGVMRFELHPGFPLAPEAAQRAYLAGPEAIPWRSRNRLAGSSLHIERDVTDSGCLHIPWVIDGQGELTLRSATLMERAAPYQLPLELARGKLSQVRQQICDWQGIGLSVPSETVGRLAEAVHAFSDAVVTQNDPERSAQAAQRALEAAQSAGELLAEAFSEQVLASRHRNEGRLDAFLGVGLDQAVPDPGASRAVTSVFHMAEVPLNWLHVETSEGQCNWDLYDRQFAWCADQGLQVAAGPLIQLDHLGLPDWLCLWEGDFDNLSTFVANYVQQTVLRYRGRVHLWHCAGRLNATGVLGLSEEDKLRLAVRAVEVARQLDPETPLVIRFDQPWAEYLHRSRMDFSPLHFADALARSGLGLGGIDLELNVGYFPGGSARRDLLEIHRLIDQWSSLELPLYVTLTCPSSEADDAQSRCATRPMPGGWTPERQQGFAARVIPLLLAKTAVRGVFWNQLRDDLPHDFPHGGLIDAAGRAKPALRALAALRQAHLH